MEDVYKTHGTCSWFELMTTDVAAAKDFYTKLFGWTTEEIPMEGGTYNVIKVADKAVAGMMTMPPEVQSVPPHWGVYVTVDDVDATAKLAEEMGAKILVPPRDIPKVGRFCVIQDPQGAALAAISYVEM